MNEEYLIRYCAPTLAGIKTGNTFTCPYKNREDLLSAIRSANRKLKGKGLRLIPLRFSQKRALLYLFRPKGLKKDLSQDRAAQLLKQQGYSCENCEQCVAQLVRRIRNQEDFPHEIGLFLGYPAEDVKGFMDNNACDHKCVGCWKVYGDEAAARKRFDQYKKCTRVYCDLWKKGKDIERLTVAG